jgi:AraC-like DNA-binding protein
MNVTLGEQRIRAFVFTGLGEALKSYSRDRTGILRQAGLPDDIGTDGFAWVSLDRFALALALAARATGDPYFGLRYGASGRLTPNPLGYVMANAPDLRTALKSFVHYHRVLTTNHFDFVESAGVGRVEWSYAVTMPNVTQLSDFVLARFIWRVQCAVGTSWRPMAVSLTHRQPADLAEYERRLGPRIAFNQQVNSFSLTSATLALPIPGADAELFKLVTRFCEEQVERQCAAAHHPLHDMREVITRCLERGTTSPRVVAAEAGLSASALNRRLKAEGTTFARLLDDTRRCLAQRYLFESSLKLTDIAARVGYSELSAFSRAARRWFGASPRAFRRGTPNLDEAA